MDTQQPVTTEERPREWVRAYCDAKNCGREWEGDGAQEGGRVIRQAQAHANLTGHVVSVEHGHRAHAIIEEA